VALGGQPAEPPAGADPPPTKAEPAELPDAASAPLAADGGFHLNLPDLSEVREPLEIAVLAPSGATLEHTSLKLKQLESELVLTATPAQPFVVRPSDDPTLGEPKRLTGRVIGHDGRSASAGLPLVLYGLNGAAGAAARPLLSLKTQVGGYFSGDRPSDSLVAAYGEIGGERAPISLVDGRLPQRAVLVVDLPAVEEECGCTPSPPRAPDQIDLVANSEAYSQDLGGGCVNLTMPNRVIEEYSYFTVVRITEPDVRPMNTEPPHRIPPEVLRRIADLVVDDRLTDRSLRAIAAEPMAAGHINGEVVDHGNGAEGPAEGPDGGRGGPVEGGSDGGLDGVDRATAAQKLIFSLDTRRASELLADPARITQEGVLAAAVKSEAIDLHRLIDLLRGRPTRTALDGRHSIDWDATPTVYEATTVALGHVLHFRQVWRADGYSLGDLLYSLPLAPGQKRLVSMVDWTRRTTGERTEELESEEEMRALAERDRDVSEIVGSHLDEQIDGGSSTSTSAGGGGIGAGFIGSGFGVLAGVAGGASGSESTSWQDSSRTLSGNSLQQLRDRTTQRASAVRSVRSTVVQTVTQGETVRAETEVVANHNHCHALTVEYFEVLRHFQVAEELAYVSECVFVPLPMLPFDQPKARRWRATLLEWLRRPQLGKGFDAIDRIATNWDGWDYPEHRFSEEAPEELDGELRISFVIPRPHDDEDGAFQIDGWNWLTPFLWGAPFSVFNQMADHVNNLFRDINRQMTAEFYTQIQRARDEYFAREVAPRVAERIVHRMRFGYVTRAGVQVPLPMDATLVSKYAEGVPLYVSIRAAGALPPLPREEIHRFRVYLDDNLFAGLPFTFDVVPPEARILVTSARARYRTPHLTHLLFDNPWVNNDLGDGDDVLIATPTAFEERKDPRAEDRRAADQLVKHLNEHLEFYHQAVWSSLDPQRRYLLLDGIVAPNSGGRSVASVVENRLIGIVGNCMVLPVTPGIHLDPTLAPDPNTGERIDLIHAYAADPPQPTRISVPTRGVYAEAIPGECDACEKKDDTRFWRWEESPLPDEPTPIEPISTDSRQAPEADATPTPLPQPIVNIQNAPGLPDPLGLTQAMEILGRSDIFREASGLAGTQRNALAAFQGVMDTAKAFGGMAAQLAQQQELGRTVDRTLEQIKGAQATGMLSQQQASDLAHAALQSLAGDAGAEHQNPVHDPDVSKAIEKATESKSGSVVVTSPGETVTTSFDDGESSGTALGAATVPVSENLEGLVTLPLVRDKQTTDKPPWKYDKSEVISDLAGARDFSVVARSDLGKALDFWDLLVKEKYVVPDAGAGTFQVRVRMRVTYPSVPGKSAELALKGKLPIAVLVHGNHGVWGAATLGGKTGTTRTFPTPWGPKTYDVYEVIGGGLRPSFEGYAYLQDELARQGIVSISVDCNLANALDLLIETRTDLVLEALKLLSDQSKKAGSKYQGRLDFDRVGLMGHSRGGDAVVRAAKRLAGTAPGTVKALCSLAPTDFTGGDVPASRMFLDAADAGFYLVVYGALDGDVDGTDGPDGPGGTGFRHYDRARGDKAMVFLDKAHHNSFNTVWHTDGLDTTDGRTLDKVAGADPKNHKQLALDYIAELFRWRLKGESALAVRFDGRKTNSVGTEASMQWLFGTSVKRFDDFERVPTNLLGGATKLTIPAADANIGAVRDENQVTHGGKPGTKLGILMPHQSHMLQLEWGKPRATGVTAYTTDVPAAHQDWSALDTLLISIGGYYDPTSQTTINAEWLPRIRLVLSDDAGKSAVVDFNGYGASVPSKPIFTKKDGVHESTMMRLETVPVQLSLFAGVDLHKVKQLALELEPAGIVTAFVDSIHVVKR
jgi:hypothetical protein